MMDPFGTDEKPQNASAANNTSRITPTTPIVITEVTTTRTIMIDKNADLSDPNIAALVSQLKATQMQSSSESSSALGAHYIPKEMGNHEDDDDVHYISDDEGNPSGSGSHRPSQRSGGHSSGKSKTGGWSPPTSPGQHKRSTKNSSSEDILEPLGSFSEIDNSSEVAKMIKIYTKNSIYIKRGSELKVKVCRILKKDGLLSNIFPGNGGHVTKSVHKKKNKTGKILLSSRDELSMLLWFKTSPDSVRRLASGKDSCTAFYDRASRALPLPIDKIKQNGKQTLLLCKVTLGNMHKAQHGYSHWRRNSHPPRGCDSVKGVGKWKPNWAKNLKHKSTIVPVGESEKSARFSTFDIDYNEYMVFSSRQIKVKYAVEIEFVSSQEMAM